MEDYGKCPKVDAAVKRAIATPDDFVLKPQKEGGGNNFYGDELRQKLLDLDSVPDGRTLLLMEKIRPPIVPIDTVI